VTAAHQQSSCKANNLPNKNLVLQSHYRCEATYHLADEGVDLFIEATSLESGAVHSSPVITDTVSSKARTAKRKQQPGRIAIEEDVHEAPNCSKKLLKIDFHRYGTFCALTELLLIICSAFRDPS
jgi:hypothetical protein